MIGFAVIFALGLSAFTLGWLVVNRFWAVGGLFVVERLFLYLFIGIAGMGWSAFLLAELGIFSLTAVGGLWLTAVAVLGAMVWKKRSADYAAGRRLQSKNLRNRRNQRTIELAGLGFWFLAALWLFFRPHEYVLGGGDAGVYVSLGAEIAERGGILIDDALLSELPVELTAVFLRQLPEHSTSPTYLLPGFYVDDASSGAILPQFYHLYPVWMALAYGLAGGGASGVGAALLTTGFWALLGSLAIYLTARRIGGWKTAVLTLIGLSFCAMQVWFARYSTTEAMTQYFLWTGFWAIGGWMNGRRPANLWALVAGLALGQFFLARIDSLFVAPLLALFVFWLWARGWTRPASYFLAALTFLTAHSLLHALWQSRPYFFDQFSYGLRIMENNWIPLALAAAATAVALPILKTQQKRWHTLARYRRPVLGTIIVGLLLLAGYSWFIRPYGEITPGWADPYGGNLIPIVNNENLLRLGWYLSPIGVWLGIAGTCLLIWKVNRETAVLLALTLFFSLFYIWNIRNNPHQIYAMRRYVPAVMPLFVLGAAYFIGWLGGWERWEIGRLRAFKPAAADLRAFAAVVLAIVWLGGMIWSARGFVMRRDWRGVTAQLDNLNQQLEPNAILLFNDQSPVGMGDLLGTPLKFIYGHDPFTLRYLEELDDGALLETMENWQENGRVVYWFGDNAWLDKQQIPYSQTRQTITGNTLEHSYEHKPTAVTEHHWTLNISRIDNLE